MKNNLTVIGLKKVAGATKRIGIGEKGIVTFDTKTGKVDFDGVWYKDVEVKITGSPESEIGFWVYKPMTMREIKKQIAEFVDYDLFIEMNMEDTGHKKINGKWVYVG